MEGQPNLFEILRLQNVSAALDVKDHLVEPDLGRVRVPQVLVVVDELRADGQPQLDHVGLPVEVDEADEGDCREEERRDDDQEGVAGNESAVPDGPRASGLKVGLGFYYVQFSRIDL